MDAKAENKTKPKFEVHYRHPVAVFVSGLVSLVYVVLCWLSYIIIILSSCAVIIGLFLPRQAWHVLSSMINQYHIERQFKDEL